MVCRRQHSRVVIGARGASKGMGVDPLAGAAGSNLFLQKRCYAFFLAFFLAGLTLLVDSAFALTAFFTGFAAFFF